MPRFDGYTLEAYHATMLFIELTTFRSLLRLTDDELRRVQVDIIANPECGDLIRGGGGLRKMRVAIGGRGKSGGARVIYYLQHFDRCYLVLAYSKKEQEDLTPKQLKTLALLVKKELWP